MARLSFWGIFAIAAAAVGAAAYLYPERSALLGPGPEGAPAKAAKALPGPVVVEAGPVVVDTVVEDIQAVGTLLPNETVVVSPEIAGRIQRIAFVEGDAVEAGALLVELDSAILRAEMAKAQSDLTLAEANRERAETLARQGTGTLRARDEALAAHRQAVANVALAQARLEKTAIAAPFAGIVGLRAVSVGAFVEPGDRLVELADLDPIKVDFRVPELALSNLRVGQPIRVAVDALPGRAFEGEVYAIDPLIDPNGRAVRLRARVANPDRVLSPGLFARVQVVVERRENAVLVPESAVFAETGRRLVFRVVEGRAVETAIELGRRRPGQVEVRSGLAPGDVVVTAGHQKLRDGAAVELAEPAAGSAAQPETAAVPAAAG